jgi:hypothetical protein
MQARPLRLSISVLAVGSLLAACGDDGAASGVSAAETVPAATVAATAPPTTVAASTVLPVDEECNSELRTMQVAVEAYYAQNGEYPTSEAELVQVQFIRVESAAYDLVPDTGEVVRVPGVPCPADDSAEQSAPMTADDMYATLTEQEIAGFGGTECARELMEIAAAGERFVAREGRNPESLDEMAVDLDIEPVLWQYDTGDETLTPAPGSPCVDFPTQEAASICEAERNTLTVAVEAYTAQYGAPPASEDDLVGGFLRQSVERYDLDGSAQVVVAPGGPCDTVPAPTTTAP